jgi:prevent-host-death family protein
MPASQAAGDGGRSAPDTVVTGSGRSGTAHAVSRLSDVTTSVGVHEAKTHLSRLLERVAAGEEVEITNRGKVVARLVGPARRTPNFGFDRGNVWIADDFDDLPEDLQRAFEGDE